jgi:hypothetical protein
MLSFIIYYHSSRIDNLTQTLRILQKREPDLDAELVLICQDESPPVETRFPTQLIELKSPYYHKPFMCNIGVRKAKRENIVLLDSDRILPQGYFTQRAAELAPRTAVAPMNLYTLRKPYSDEELDQPRIKLDWSRDFRSEEVLPMAKNLFAGNVLMKRDDYLAVGGMDESYRGYGFADNDMTQSVLRSGIKQILTNDEELHLFHPRDIYWEDMKLPNNQYMIMTALNGLRYHRKWALPMQTRFVTHLHRIAADLESFPEPFREEFRQQYHIL